MILMDTATLTGTDNETSVATEAPNADDYARAFRPVPELSSPFETREVTGGWTLRPSDVKGGF